MVTSQNLDSRAAEPRKRARSAEALRQLRRALGERRDGGLQAAYGDARWRTLWLRLVFALLELALPITQVVAFAGEVNQRIRQQGLAKASTESANRLGLECEFVFSEAAQRALTTLPVIVYGNHPTIMTPFLLAAAAGRDDMRFFIVDYALRLIPSLGEYVLPLRTPPVRILVEWRRGGIKRVISRRLARLFMEHEDRATARQANCRSLAEGVRHLEEGGCIVIFPGGGGHHVGKWYPGIARLVENVRGHPEAPDVFLLPMHEDGGSEAQIYEGLRHLNRGTSSKHRTGFSARVRFAEPRRLQDFVPPETSCDQIIRKLEADYAATFPRLRTVP